MIPFKSMTAQFCYFFAAAVMTTVCSSCGVNDEGRWKDAEGAEEFFGGSVTRQGLSEGDMESLMPDCDAMLSAAQSSLEEAGSPGGRVLIQICSKDGLGFGNELRCVDDRLQVRCL
ncbi:hypothetical protein [Congregibacter sp.]|uniref:hypothetical protein n=1 Tax=Congregibacter sp. TaxID=2744308 RepID=UPI003F6BB863